ncbi:MAG: TlyA family RNA methyltransferase [Acidobacteria bacterium]|jgi:23S rRNA (cytidine1920-2'-O)/16S rRNA (cytidine1409-2'-O)-methyltransferase|nr:MAG: TlyA family RNA methyltransferase [Acidobacteriota bacterium]
MSRKRLDLYLVEKGYAPSREKAQTLIMAGLVFVDGKLQDKPGTYVREGQRVEVKSPPKFVSRAGYKLEDALDRFNIDVQGFTALDVGSSTGGFTQCLLMRGAKRVYAVDVGKGQMDPLLRRDERVALYEETDARELTEKHVPEPIDIITIDVSFISVTKILSHVIKFLREGGVLLVLVKPQFEVGPQKVRKGIVRDLEAKRQAIMKVISYLHSLGFKIGGLIKARPRGSKGNEEFFLLAGRKLVELKNIEEAVEEALNEAI